MGENLHDIDKLFKDGMDSYEEAPAPAIWNSIENNLDKEDRVRLRRSNRFLKRGALVLLVFLGISLIFLYKYTNKDNPADLTIQPTPRIPDSTTEEKSQSLDQSTDNKTGDREKLPITDNTPSATDKEVPSTETESVLPSTKKNSAPLSYNKPNRKQNAAEKDNAFEKSGLPSNEAAYSETNKRKKEINRGINFLEGTQNSTSIVKSTQKSRDSKNTVPHAIITGNQEKHFKPRPQNSEELIQKDAAATEVFASREKGEMKNASVVTSSNPRAERQQSREALKGIPMLDRKSIQASGPLNPMAVVPATPLPKHSTTKAPNAGKGAFAISLFYSPNLNIQKVQDGERKHMEDDRNRISEGEKVKSSASYGLTGSYSFNKKWAVQVGLQVFHQTSVIEPKNLFARHDDRRGNPPNSGELRYKFNCAAGYVFLDPKSGTTPAFGDSVTALRSENSLSYTSIPVTVQYTTQWGKLKFNGVAGLGFNILSKSELQSSYVAATGIKTQSVDPVQGLKSMYVSGIIGAGLDYPLSQRLSVYVLPNISFSVSPINKNTPALTKLNTFGLQSGLKFRL